MLNPLQNTILEGWVFLICLNKQMCVRNMHVGVSISLCVCVLEHISCGLVSFVCGYCVLNV